MFKLDSLRGQKLTVSVCENSIVLFSAVEKIVFLAHPIDYDLSIDPPGIRGCDLPVDEQGNISSVNNCSVFENNRLYTIVDIASIACDDKPHDTCYSKIVLSLCNVSNEVCIISLISSKICVDVLGVFDFGELVEKNVKLKISKNNLTIEQVNDKWIFVAQPDNYVVRIDQETGLPDEEHINLFMRLLENGLTCKVLDISYFDDMLGETTIKFNLYFTTLSITIKTDADKIYCLEMDTAKMQVLHEQSSDF